MKIYANQSIRYNKNTLIDCGGMAGGTTLNKIYIRFMTIVIKWASAALKKQCLKLPCMKGLLMSFQVSDEHFDKNSKLHQAPTYVESYSVKSYL